MCDWKRWTWPGIIATVFLTALALWFRAGTIESDLAANIAHALGNGHWATIAIEGRDVTVSGIAPDEDLRAEALRLVRDAGGVRAVHDRTELAGRAEPYRFSAVKNATGIVLAGHFPQVDAHAAVTGAAAEAFPGFAVTDTMTLARGAPDGYTSQAEFALAQLARLATGEVDVTGDRLSVKGRAADASAHADLRRDLSGILPAGLQAGSIEIEPPAGASAPGADAGNGG
ncbi:BON domain-containing protein [Zhengella sp. ZM62]|uniref:BON domain-containing protein n=1 Tax=Zhengella sedimenti TaxID=3390035 RepID=UPI00397684BA